MASSSGGSTTGSYHYQVAASRSAALPLRTDRSESSAATTKPTRLPPLRSPSSASSSAASTSKTRFAPGSGRGGRVHDVEHLAENNRQLKRELQALTTHNHQLTTRTRWLEGELEKERRKSEALLKAQYSLTAAPQLDKLASQHARGQVVRRLHGEIEALRALLAEREGEVKALISSQRAAAVLALTRERDELQEAVRALQGRLRILEQQGPGQGKRGSTTTGGGGGGGHPSPSRRRSHQQQRQQQQQQPPSSPARVFLALSAPGAMGVMAAAVEEPPIPCPVNGDKVQHLSRLPEDIIDGTHDGGDGLGVLTWPLAAASATGAEERAATTATAPAPVPVPTSAAATTTAATPEAPSTQELTTAVPVQPPATDAPKSRPSSTSLRLFPAAPAPPTPPPAPEQQQQQEAAPPTADDGESDANARQQEEQAHAATSPRGSFTFLPRPSIVLRRPPSLPGRPLGSIQEEEGGAVDARAAMPVSGTGGGPVMDPNTNALFAPAEEEEKGLEQEQGATPLMRDQEESKRMNGNGDEAVVGSEPPLAAAVLPAPPSIVKEEEEEEEQQQGEASAGAALL